MNRAAGIALLILAFAPGLSRAGDEPTAPVADKTWEERDLEGRWALYRASEGPKPGSKEDPWVPFFARRKEFQLLEWVAMTSAAPAALEALAKADAPGWVRCAVWLLIASDNHVRGGALEWLKEKRPGLTLAWIDRFPKLLHFTDAFLAELRAKNAKREDASALLPPLEIGTALADLAPPSDVVDWGARARAESGRTYVHQVERAIDMLGLTLLEGEPWAGRLAALVSHANPRVRRAAALAYARRPRLDVPIGALLARVDDEKETPEVRAAALLGASFHDHPAAYAKLVSYAHRVSSPIWRAAVSRLGDIDDGFVIGIWEALGPQELAGNDRTFATEQIARIREGVASRDASALPYVVQRMLERAAWVDLQCDPLEGSLVAWTLKSLKAKLDEAGVREAVKSAHQYEPWFTAAMVEGPDPAAVRDRVRLYAKELLEGGDKPLGPR